MEKKIFIELEIQDDWPPCDTEWVWGEKLSNSLTLYQINNVPKPLHEQIHKSSLK